MVDDRQPPRHLRRASRAQFRCRSCRRFIRATEHGTCPRCGLEPPQAIPHPGASLEPRSDADHTRLFFALTAALLILALSGAVTGAALRFLW